MTFRREPCSLLTRPARAGTRRHIRTLAPDARRELEQYGPRTLDDGADTAVWLASSDEAGGVTATFFERRREIPCEFRNEQDEERLWQACERLSAASAPRV